MKTEIPLTEKPSWQIIVCANNGYPEPLELPTIDKEPFPNAVVLYVDYMLNRLVSLCPANLTAENDWKSDKPIPWFINALGNDRPPMKAGEIPQRFFRTILARFGHHYLDDQLYGGYVKRIIAFQKSEYRLIFHMGNDGHSGNWIRVSARKAEDKTANTVSEVTPRKLGEPQG